MKDGALQFDKKENRSFLEDGVFILIKETNIYFFLWDDAFQFDKRHKTLFGVGVVLFV